MSFNNDVNLLYVLLLQGYWNKNRWESIEYCAMIILLLEKYSPILKFWVYIFWYIPINPTNNLCQAK